MPSRTPSSGAPFIALAGQSVRMLAQSARRAGLRVAALDLFGDRDTREASQCWFDIGNAAHTIDRARLVSALGRVARLPRLVGWIGGSGLEPFVAELAGNRALPPYIGSRADAIATVREPHRFFALLDELGIAHPPVSFTPPPSPEGWLHKLADGYGGVHIHDAASAGADVLARESGYFQRRRDGRPMSALFIAARGEARVIGFAEQTVLAWGDLPYIHTGSLGPIELPAPLAERIAGAIGKLCARVSLAGINSFDFLQIDDDTFELLEVNARPSSTITLYENAWPRAWSRGLLACHLDACLRGVLPDRVPHASSARWRVAQAVLFAPRAFVASAAFSDACAHDPGCADVPMPGVRIDTGQPVCTLLARGESLAAVEDALAQQRGHVLERLFSCHEPAHDFNA